MTDTRHPYFTRGRTVCSLDDCDRYVASKATGYCNRHNYKFLRYGDPLAGRTLVKRGTGGRYIAANGYVIVVDEKRNKNYEHRLVMEQILGRCLWPDENVHHINGIRGDNRPENLELWCKPQPQGQRVSDLLAWVVENYRTEVEELLQ